MLYYKHLMDLLGALAASQMNSATDPYKETVVRCRNEFLKELEKCAQQSPSNNPPEPLTNAFE